MLYRKNGQWDLCPYKITYNQYGEQFEKYTEDRKWWLDFADAWEHTRIVEITEVEHTTEQLERFEDIKYMPEDFGDMYSDYVEFGIFETETLHLSHPFLIIKLRKENEDLSMAILELAMSNAKMELETQMAILELAKIVTGGAE
ncbi:hypothetical protein CSV80_00920 [Sporosarcina sp. P12(2017)]|uniref:hypothetical protein n=1 Tax=unclassified Sporosarcina TaxID=2647733 RepID=UPI000C162F7C|nr:MULTISPECIES: hypothetical protein [unclassified Sporosarcina]PIC59118.1 hypothetical protein CSV81_00920 [Sporosarcina sp. P10]PIC62439.1 hypothetical protein CSV80_00920 [Sporosarcina sp. P12(2017)]